MKKFLLLVLIFLSISCIAQDVLIDKNAQKRVVDGFTAIKVSGAIDVYLSGGAEALAVSASDDKYRDRIKTEVVDGTLKIWYDGGKFNWSSGNKKLRAYVSFKNLSKLEASGASSFKISGILDLLTLSIRLSGASDVKGAVKIERLSVDIRGASDVKITGTVGSLNVDASGASNLKGYDLTVNSCTARLSGASDVRVTVNEELNVVASGASSVFYKGNGVIKSVHSSGASSVVKKS